MLRLAVLCCRIALGLMALALSAEAASSGGSRTLAFSGRLVDDHGAPVAGPVDLKVSLFRSDSGGEVLSPTALPFGQVALSDGVFHITLTFAEGELAAMFPAPSSLAYLQVQDVTHQRTYKRHPIMLSDLSAEAVAPAPPPPSAGPVPGASLGPVLATSLPATVAVTAAAPATAAGGPAVEAGHSSDPALTAALGACLGQTAVGAKFIVRNTDKSATCGASCDAAKASARCLRGWTLFSEAQVFEFGNECGAVQVTPSLPSQGHLCCCSYQSAPTPVLINLP